MTMHRPAASDIPPRQDFTVAIVEDEAVLREELAFQLGHMGYRVETFGDAGSFYRFLAVSPRTIAVIDIGLPGEDSLEICRHLRANGSQIGLIFATARGLRNDRLEGLSAGADAYLVKPVDVDELALLIRRLAERFGSALQAADDLRSSAGGWVLDGSLLISPAGKPVPLTMKEFPLLSALMSSRGETCPYAKLASVLGILDDEWDKHRIEVIISRLRLKVERSTGEALPIRAVRSQGYCFA